MLTMVVNCWWRLRCMTLIVTLESISNNHHTKLFCMVVFNCTSSLSKGCKYKINRQIDNTLLSQGKFGLQSQVVQYKKYMKYNKKIHSSFGIQYSNPFWHKRVQCSVSFWGNGSQVLSFRLLHDFDFWDTKQCHN